MERNITEMQGDLLHFEMNKRSVPETVDKTKLLGLIVDEMEDISNLHQHENEILFGKMEDFKIKMKSVEDIIDEDYVSKVEHLFVRNRLEKRI